jgi:hypothetical protein
VPPTRAAIRPPTLRKRSVARETSRQNSAIATFRSRLARGGYPAEDPRRVCRQPLIQPAIAEQSQFMSTLVQIAVKNAEKTRTQFTFRTDRWTKDELVEHIAGIEDYQVALATFRAACERWPSTPITLRQGSRVIEESRRLRLAGSDEGRLGGR